MSELILSRIFVYPIKSLGGMELDFAQVEPRGLRHDRRWLLVDAQGVFMTQRKHPRMALARVEIQAEHLAVNADGAEPLLIPLGQPAEQPAVPVQIWRHVCDAQYVGDFADRWFSDFLRVECRLVYMPESTRREVDPNHARNGEIVSFADGYPALVLGQASLDALNAQLAHQLPINRFRPNLVVSGGEAFAEYGWRQVTVGSATFRGTKPCERCVVTTINQDTGISEGPEPLKTLARLGREQHGTVFGQNLTVQAPGEIRVGQGVRI